jgi:pyruvate/2-oxoglutarate dehydrogenase complex dihydrolipoamide dehydrogenase (E3) component
LHPGKGDPTVTTTGHPLTAASLPEAPPGGWDLLVIGGGTAGIIGAQTAAGLGASVLLVERQRTGGDCLWTGCVPSKALLAAAGHAASVRRAASFGVRVSGVDVDFAAVMAHVRQAVATIEPVDSPQALRAQGVQVVHGRVRFTGPRTVAVEVAGDRREVAFRQAVIATGSRPRVPDVPGLAGAVASGRCLTTDTVWDLGERPDRLVVLGGGPTGCELGQAFARLGSRVTLVETGARILATEEPEASAAVARALRNDGVTVLTGVRARAIRPGHGVGQVAAVELDGGTDVTFDRLLVTTGRVPLTAELGLEAAGVDVDDAGCVVVDRTLRTSNPHVWAAGDVTAHPRFTHVAGVHAGTVAVNAVLGLRRRAETRVIPRVTFTDPEVAAVGVTGPGAARPGWRTVTRSHTAVDRAVTDDATGGYARLVLDARGRLQGATVVGPRAGESLAELVLAMSQGNRTRAIASAMHAYPTYGDGPWHAAIADGRAGLRRGIAARVVRALARGRRRWLELRG